jgi:uncharacterized membrane protein
MFGPITWEELHGSLTHFPVALFLMAFFFDYGALFLKKPEWRYTSFMLLVAGIVVSFPVIFTGFMIGFTLFGSPSNYPPIFVNHRDLGIATFVVALVLVFIRWRSKDTTSSPSYGISMGLMLLLAILVSITGHLGGTMVFASSGSSEPTTSSSSAPVASAPKSPAQLALQQSALQTMKQNNCFGCHSFDGQGGKTAPDLTHEGSRHPDPAWLEKFIKNPSSVNPGSFMPSFASIPQDKLNQLTQFLASQK